jgi:hypothetical protein
MKTELPIRHRGSLHTSATGRVTSLCCLLVALLVSAGMARGGDEVDPQEPAKAAAKKSKTPKAKADSASPVPKNDVSKGEVPKGKGSLPGADGPSSDHPDWPLALWSDGPTVEWRAQAGACATEAERLIAALEKTGTKKAVNQRITAVNRAHVLIIQLARFAARLRTWSEPAGADLELRRDELTHRLATVIAEIRSDRPQLVADMQTTSRERCQKAKKTLEQIRKLRADGKLEAAETKLIKLYDDLVTLGAWYPLQDPHPPLFPFEDLLRELNADLQPARLQAGRDAMKRYRDQQLPDYAELVAQVGAATAAVTAGRKYDSAGKMLGGPQALELFLGRWQDLHFQTLHVRAIDSAIAAFNDQLKVLHDDASTNEPYRKFEADIAGALVKLIDADAGSLKADAVATHYAAYVHALAPTLSLASDDSFTRQFQTALDRMAEKSPPLAAQLDTYRLATSDMLRWRARLAGAQRARVEPRQPVATSFKSNPTESAATMIRSLSPELVGKPSVGQDLIGTPASQRAASALAEDGSYCVVPLDPRLQTASASLRAALLCADSAEPLNLETAVALERAERGDLVAVGGPVKQIELDGFVPMWARADSWGLARLDRQPGATTEPLRLRIELEPRWYHQAYAFVELQAVIGRSVVGQSGGWLAAFAAQYLAEPLP